MDTKTTTPGLFGALVKKRRAELELGLREFCEKIAVDPSNWSKIERGFFHPPADKATLDHIADALKLDEKQTQELIDYADLDRKKLPRDISEDQYVLQMLPAFMRTLRETKPSEEEMDALLKLLREDFKKKA